MALALSACGGADERDEDPAERRVPAAERMPFERRDEDPAKRRVPAAAERTPFERRDAPPAGVAELVSNFQIGDPPCQSQGNSGEPAIRFEPTDHVEITRSFSICLPGFAPGRPIRALVRRADGREVKLGFEDCPECDQSAVKTVEWIAFPGDPVGRYTVFASGEGTKASASFDVRRASKPAMRVLGSGFVAPGKPVRLGLVGFRPEEQVRVHLYRERSSVGPDGAVRAFYLTSITVRVNQEGQAIHEIPSDVDDPRGNYVLDAKQSRASFHLGELPPAN